jgi:hypothetical protein
MGAYFSIFGIRKISAKDALSAFRAWEHPEGDPMEVFPCPSGNSLILCDGISADAGGLARGLAHKLHAAVIVLSFADDVVWSYELYTDSGLADEYSSRPNYWDKDVDAFRFAGNPHKVCETWDGVSVERISRYLTNKEELKEADEATLAYPDDKAPRSDGWQMCDFMRCLGLEYPINEDGELIIEPAGQVTVATARGVEQRTHMRRRSAQIDEMVNKLQIEGEWPG